MLVVKVEDLLNQIENDFNGVCVYDVTPSEAINDFENSVYSAGVFNIVNCNECKYCITHYRGSLGYYCARDYNEFRVEPDDFCSQGEQKCSHRNNYLNILIKTVSFI